MNNIFTGNYFECKFGNLISISKDKGKDANFNGKAILDFAPKPEFFKKWRSNIGKIPEIENTKYYINEYYKQVLSQIDILGLLENEKNPILLCYEKNQDFCHRHVLAEYIELVYDKRVLDIKIDEDFNIEINKRPDYIKPMLYRTIIENLLMTKNGNIEENKKIIFKIIPELEEEEGFDQKNPWHKYDVWNHTLVAISNSESDLELRLALLLHDIGKPKSFQDDGDIRHFKGHAEKSAEIAEPILMRLGYEDEEIERICYLIKNHSSIIDLENVSEKNIDITKKLLKLQYCDAKAYNPEYIPKALKRLNIIKEKIDRDIEDCR